MSYARRLLNAVGLPGGASRLLQHDRYWRTDVTEALCDRCDELREVGDPAEEEYLAEVAFDLVARLREASAALRVRVLSVLGTARRRLGRYSQAERCYDLAWRLSDRGEVPLRLVADLAERQAVLLREQGRPQPALDMIRYALLLRESLGESAAPARVIEGIVLSYLGEMAAAKARFVDVLRHADPRLEERAYTAALENLAYLLGTYGSPEELVAARALTTDVRQVIRGIRRTPVRYRVDWIDAVLHRRLGDARRARKDLRRARRGFIRLGMLAEVATLTVDLASVEIEIGDRCSVPTLLAETLDWIRSADADSSMVTVYHQALERDSPLAMVEELQTRVAPTTDPGRAVLVPLGGGD